jgi:hypothetical protein
MSVRKQQTLPVVRAVPSGFGSAIKGDVAVIRFVRKISAEFSYPEGQALHQRLAAIAGVVLAAAFSGDQNDAPRNLIIVDNGVGVGNAGDVIVTGYDQYGELVTETIAITTLGSTEGVTPFTWITQIEFPAITDTNIEVQMGNAIGVAADLSSGDLKACSHDAAGGGAKSFVNISGFTLNTTYDTIEFTGVAIAAGDVFDYYVKG